MKPSQIFFFLFFTFASTFCKAQLLAFPSAEGSGKFVSGGRGSISTAPTVYEVTNLGDVNAAGSFRYACTNGSAARVVVFRVSGTIHLTSALTLKANTTIAGQTAPGAGICIADMPVSLGGNNIIVRYMRFRLGDKNQNLGMVNGSGNDDAFGDNGAGRQKVILDHCTASWSNDEALTMYKGDSTTIQWCMISEPLNYSYHFETGDVDFEQHAYGGIWGGKHATFHHNLFAHLKGRGPRFDGIRNIAADSGDFRNNVIYDWADYNTNGGEGGAYNIVNNYYKYGPSTLNTVTSGVNRRNMLINPYKQSSPAIPYGRYYLTGNYCDYSTAVTSNNWLGAAMSGGSLADTTQAKASTPFNCTNIVMQDAAEAYNRVLASVGCSLPNRDTLDERIVDDVRNRGGRLIDVQGGFPHGTAYALTVNAWPYLASGTSQADSDHDGMPDIWENARGLNPLSAADRNSYITTNGYNNLENYINGDSITAVGTLNTCVGAKSVVTSNSGQWLHASDSSFSDYLSSTYTGSLDSNQLVASVLDDGQYGTFNVSYYTTNTLRNDGAGHYYLNRNITVNPVNPGSITKAVTIRMYISKAEFNAFKAVDLSLSSIADLRILRVPGNTCTQAITGFPQGIIPSATSEFGTYKNGYYVQFQTSDFGTFFFGSATFPLPVNLRGFKVKKEGGSLARISWVTSQEINSKQFQVQRSGIAQHWRTLATIPAQGNSNAEKSYSYEDAEIKKGVYYYRLNQQDMDGKSLTSEIRNLNFDSDRISVKVYPDPADNFLQIQVVGADAFEVVLVDKAGKKVYRNSVTGSAYQMNTSGFASGMYTLWISNSSHSVHTKILLQH